MPRPPKVRSPAEHTLVLARVGRALERDSSLEPRLKRELVGMVAQLIAKLQKAIPAVKGKTS